MKQPHPPHIRKPAAYALALLDRGMDPATVETLQANRDFMAVMAEIQ